MPLENFCPAHNANPPPTAILSFLEEADSRCDAFFDSGVRKKIPRFIPADYNRIFQAINAVKSSDALIFESKENDAKVIKVKTKIDNFLNINPPNLLRCQVLSFHQGH